MPESVQRHLPLALSGIQQHYPGAEALTLRDIDLELASGERLALLGPSGSGKSTLLQIIAGFLVPNSGSLTIMGKESSKIPPSKRDIGLVFQSLALFPHMSVAQNVGFGLRMRRVERQEADRRIEEALALVGMTSFADRRPDQISGGQKQRVAFARAIVTKPSLLLLDEPFGALDTRLREQIRREFMDLQRSTGLPTILVTHDQEEALEFGDRVVVLEDGVIRQQGSPRELYLRPTDPFVANFVGKGKFVNGHVTDVAGSPHLTIGNEWTLPHHALRPEGGATLTTGERVRAFVRPEWLSLVGAPAAPTGEVSSEAAVTIGKARFVGSSVEYDVALPDGQSLVVSTEHAEAPLQPGDAAVLRLRDGVGIPVFPAEMK